MSYSNGFPKVQYQVVIRKAPKGECSHPIVFDGVPTRYAILCALDWQKKNAELPETKVWWQEFYNVAVHLQIDGDYTGDDAPVKAKKHGFFVGDAVVRKQELFPTNLIIGELGPESYYNRKTEGYLYEAPTSPDNSNR